MMRNLYVLVIFTLFFSTGLFASEVTKVKGTNALIELGGDTASPGDQFYTVGSDGKRHGIIQITKVKGGKAIARVAKGKVEVGMTLEPRSAGAKQSRRSGGSGSDSPVKSRSYWGGMAGYSMDTMTVQVNSTTLANTVVGTPSITGSSFSAMGFFDYELFPQIWFRGLGGIEGFSVSGSNICGVGNNSTCNASIYYISGDFLGRYVFSNGKFRPWLGGGIALMFPATKSSSALQSSSISNTMVGQVTGGFDWFISKTMFIPISLEYGLLPKSNQVDATWIEFRVGVGVPFE